MLPGRIACLMCDQPDAPVLERARRLGIETGERRQQRGVDVEDALRERIEQGRVQAAHEAREQDELDAARAQRLEPRALVFEPGAEAPGGRTDRKSVV